jgi:hypothetical protein
MAEEDIQRNDRKIYLTTNEISVCEAKTTFRPTAYIIHLQ